MKEAIALERIVCLSGIRRAGKSTILFQFIHYLIESGIPPNNIALVKVDDIVHKTEDLRDVVSVYHELSGSDPKKEEIFFIFDEIHFMKSWHIQLKHFIDMKYKSKFIVSGSSKTLIYKDASESLAGRIRFIDVFPLKFSEYLCFSGLDVQSKEDIGSFYRSLVHKKEKITNQLREFIDVGGYPEWFKVKNRNQWSRILVDDYLALILFKDIVHVFKIKDPVLLERMVFEVATFTTERFSYTKLAKRLDTDRETVKLYLYYLESAGLITISEVFFPKKKARERMEKKLYLWEEGMRRALTMDSNDPRSVENIVAHHLCVLGMEKKPFFRSYYWKNHHEVDFILDTGSVVIPFEIKYRSDPFHVDGIIEFMDGHDIKKGYVITKGKKQVRTYGDKEIIFIPAWCLLLVDTVDML